MSSKNNKTKKLLQIENKKQPRKITKDESDLNKQNKLKEKNTLKKLSEKIITNEPIEKEMLKGQEHKEESKDEKNIKKSNNNLNILNSVEIPSLSTTKEKEIIIIKPRETYLKDKMLKMNYSEKLISSINKNLDNQVKTIHNEIMDNQVLITAVSKNFNNAQPIGNLSSGNLPKAKNYKTKTKLKALKDLKDEEEKIKNNLKQLLENEKLIKDESLMKSYSLKQSQTNLPLDKILKIEKLKKIELKKNAYMEQIKEIEFKIGELINNNDFSRKSKIKTFLDNFER